MEFEIVPEGREFKVHETLSSGDIVDHGILQGCKYCSHPKEAKVVSGLYTFRGYENRHMLVCDKVDCHQYCDHNYDNRIIVDFYDIVGISDALDSPMPERTGL